MAAVTRLVTLVDVDDEVPDGRRISFSARHEAVLSDGRRPLLLDDRGWFEALSGAVPDGADLWKFRSAEDIEDTARVVVGPDEPVDGDSQEDEATAHWTFVAAVLKRYSVDVDVPTLAQLPHDVVLSDRIRVRLGSSG